jgi:hypothetical protein
LISVLEKEQTKNNAGSRYSLKMGTPSGSGQCIPRSIFTLHIKITK